MAGVTDVEMIDQEVVIDRCLSSEDFDVLLRTKLPVWQRQSNVYTNDGPILFQLMDLDSFSTEGSTINNSNDHDVLSKHDQRIRSGIRLYGADEKGMSVGVNVYGFSSYFFISIPHDITLKKCEELIHFVNQSFSKSVANVVLRFEIIDQKSITETLTRENSAKTVQVLKLFIQDQTFIVPVSNFIKSDQKAGRIVSGYRFETFEEEVNLIERFLCDMRIHGCSWLEIKSNTYDIVDGEHKQTTCQLELQVSYKDIVCRDYDCERRPQYAPIRMLGFDIECFNRQNIFSDSKCDPVITIGNIVRDVRKTNDTEFKIVFALGSSLSIKDAEVICFSSERDLLISWKKFLQVVDPDAFIGYRIKKFDFTYITDRARILQIENYQNFGKNIKFSIEKADENFHGRIIFDMYHIVMKECPFLYPRDLRNVSIHLLNDSKDDVDPSMIGKMYESSLKGRQMIHSYCLKDAMLPIMLFDHLNIHQKYMESVRVTRLPLKNIVRMGKVNNNHLSFLPLLLSAHELTHVLRKTNIYGKNQSVNWTEDENVKRFHVEMYNESPCGDFFFKHSAHQGIFPRMLVKLTVQLKMSKRKLKNESDKEKKKELCCRMAAISSVLKSVPFMLYSKFCLNSRILILKNVIAYHNVLNADEKLDLVQKHF